MSAWYVVKLMMLQTHEEQRMKAPDDQHPDRSFQGTDLVGLKSTPDTQYVRVLLRCLRGELYAAACVTWTREFYDVQFCNVSDTRKWDPRCV